MAEESPTKKVSPAPFANWPGPGLRNIKRVITGHDKDGKSVFLGNNSEGSDHGDHDGVFVPGKAVQTAIYSTQSVPVEINDEKDVKWAKENIPDVIVPNGSLMRIFDIGPQGETALHRSVALVFGVIIEGEFEVSLDSGETRQMLRGDVIVNRSSMHKWKNTSKIDTGRVLFVILDVQPVIVNGKRLTFDMADLSYNQETQDIPKEP